MQKAILLFTIICIALAACADLFAQDHEGVEFVGSTLRKWEDAVNVTLRGDYAFVVTQETGLRIVNVSDLDSLTEDGFYYTPGKALDVTLSGDFAYVTAGKKVCV